MLLRPAIKLLFFICLFYSRAVFSQNVPNDEKLLKGYNKWLNTLHLDQVIIAERFGPIDQPGGVTKPITYRLVLRPAPIYKKPDEMAKAWAYLADGLDDKGLNLPLLLLNKLSEDAHVSLSQLKIEIQTDDPAVFAIQISFQNGLITKENMASVRGGDMAIDFNFNASPLTSILSHTYALKAPIPDLKKFCGEWRAFFLGRQHEAGNPIKIDTIFNENGIIRFMVSGLFNEITGEKYHEKMDLQIVLLHCKNQPLQINYTARVFYAASGSKNPPDSKYKDIADEPDFVPRIGEFKLKLEKQMQSIFHVSP